MTTQVAESPAVLLQEDLASLACHAALDLDDLVLGRDRGVESIISLKARLEESLGLKGGEQEKSVVSLDPATVVAMRYALSSTHTDFTPTTTQEIVSKADTLIKTLSEVVAAPSAYVASHRGAVEAVRNLCLALSRQATSRAPAFQDRIPKHPFRR